MTLNGVMPLFCVTLLNSAALRANYVKVVEDSLTVRQDSNKNLVFRILVTHNIRQYSQRFLRTNSLVSVKSDNLINILRDIRQTVRDGL